MEWNIYNKIYIKGLNKYLRLYITPYMVYNIYMELYIIKKYKEVIK